MKKGSKNTILILILFMVLSITGCGASNQQTVAKDREGNDITVPATVNKIISIAPAITQVLMDLELTDKIVAADTYSGAFLGENSSVVLFDMMNPDVEMLASLQADLILVSGMSKAGGDDPLKLLKDMGACVAYIPTSKTIEEIKQDVLFIAEVTKTKNKGQTLVDEMEKTINEYTEIGKSITNKKSVYFEIEPAPAPYTFGKGVYLNEMLEVVGLENIYADQTGWLGIAPETVVSANPDIIFTNVSYVENPVEEIKSREGFQGVTAVLNNQVYYVDNNACSLPNHHIAEAIKAMAKAAYPEEYQSK